MFAGNASQLLLLVEPLDNNKSLARNSVQVELAVHVRERVFLSETQHFTRRNTLLSCVPLILYLSTH